jgi:hypothetical protein
VVALLRSSTEEVTMATLDAPVVAGMISTVLFVGSYLPMLVKAFRTRDLESYSLGNLVLANVGNAVHSVYVFSLPMGPIWILHTFYVLSTALMLLWHFLYVGRVARASAGRAGPDHG